MGKPNVACPHDGTVSGYRRKGGTESTMFAARRQVEGPHASAGQVVPEMERTLTAG